MRAADVKPNRLEAAQAAARAFVADTARTTRVGIVSFAATASVVQPPTNSREDILAAIDRFQLQRGTAIGSGMLVSLKTIFPDAEFDSPLVQSAPRRRRATRARVRGPASPTSPPARTRKRTAVPPARTTAPRSSSSPTARPPPAPIRSRRRRLAAERGVRVFTVGIGTVAGEIIGAEGWSMRVRLDEESLKRIALITRGEYFYAGTAAELKKVYETLNSRMVMETQGNRDHRAVRGRGRGAGPVVGGLVDSLVQSHHVAASSREARGPGGSAGT
jgi:Ca-activated chloride channel family protein